MSLASVEAGRIRLSSATHNLAAAAARYHTVVVMAWGLVIAGLILQRFWMYWTLLI
ncbi:hypothetical protein AB0H88_30340 [Nonomuraea sp. NPDC050680]|uniref:hypothetical protein n=1 Tax=Nonomuraea sp. NPDC050680 TaxID=3154630 RepID=UPI0033DF9D78